MSTRKKGGQPGNLNALKHGFYSNRFDDAENIDLEAYLTTGLDSEVAMLRVFTRRVFELADGIQDLKEARESLGALGLAATRLATLLKSQMFLEGDQSDEVKRTITEALNEIVDDLKLKV